VKVATAPIHTFSPQTHDGLFVEVQGSTTTMMDAEICVRGKTPEQAATVWLESPEKIER